MAARCSRSLPGLVSTRLVARVIPESATATQKFLLTADGCGPVIDIKLVYNDDVYHIYLDSDTAWTLSAQLMLLAADMEPDKVGM